MKRQRSKPSGPPCAVCNFPRVFSEQQGVWVCRQCQSHRAYEPQREHVTVYEGVEVDST
jgi:ribosomal protein L37AE/L43A